MGEMGKKLGEMGNGRNGIGRNGNTPFYCVSFFANKSDFFAQIGE
jgi:hypothetical protein